MSTLLDLTRFQPTLYFLTIAGIVDAASASTVENCSYHTNIRIDCTGSETDRARAVEQPRLTSIRAIQRMNGRAAPLIQEEEESDDVCRSCRLQSRSGSRSGRTTGTFGQKLYKIPTETFFSPSIGGSRHVLAKGSMPRIEGTFLQVRGGETTDKLQKTYKALC